MAELADIADHLEAAARAMVELGPEIEGRGPWPIAEHFGTEPEASWGPPELLAHVSEMVPYWLGEIERIMWAPPGPAAVPFGRTSEDPVRLAIIGRDRTVPIHELLARISADSARASLRLRELDAMGPIARLGLHPRLGEMTLAGIAERFLASHAAEHVLQLREILAAGGA